VSLTPGGETTIRLRRIDLLTYDLEGKDPKERACEFA